MRMMKFKSYFIKFLKVCVSLLIFLVFLASIWVMNYDHTVKPIVNKRQELIQELRKVERNLPSIQKQITGLDLEIDRMMQSSMLIMRGSEGRDIFDATISALCYSHSLTCSGERKWRGRLRDTYSLILEGEYENVIAFLEMLDNQFIFSWERVCSIKPESDTIETHVSVRIDSKKLKDLYDRRFYSSTVNFSDFPDRYTKTKRNALGYYSDSAVRKIKEIRRFSKVTKSIIVYLDIFEKARLTEADILYSSKTLSLSSVRTKCDSL